MKKVVVLLLALSLMFSCGKKDDSGNTEKDPVSIVGEWVLTSYSTKAVKIGEESVDIYLKCDVSSFDLYQKIGAGRYQHFSGSYSISDNILSGTYSDGKPFGSTYTVAVEENKLTLTSQPNGLEIQTFVSTTIPPSVTDNTY